MTRKCSECHVRFEPTRPMQPTCENFACKLAYATRVASKSESKRKREVADKAKAERREDKAKREKMKKRGEWIKEAQAAINKFRRFQELDKGRGCISCGRSQEEVQGTDGWKPGGAWDGGHFVGVGANASIRFEPSNIWLQCKSCNAGSGKYAKKAATVAKAFEANLIALEGKELVDWLKGPHEPKHYTIDDIKAIRDKYRTLARELINGAS